MSILAITRTPRNKSVKNLALNLAILVIVLGCGRKMEKSVATTSSNVVPQFQIGPGDVSSVSVEGIKSDGVPNSNTAATIYIEFTKIKSSEFHTFTQEHLNQKIQIAVGSNVVAEPILRAALPGDNIMLHFHSLKEATAMAEFLKR